MIKLSSYKKPTNFAGTVLGPGSKTLPLRDAPGDMRSTGVCLQSGL